MRNDEISDWGNNGSWFTKNFRSDKMPELTLEQRYETVLLELARVEELAGKARKFLEWGEPSVALYHLKRIESEKKSAGQMLAVGGEYHGNSKNKLAVHHIDYNKLNDADNNLITLCRSCHSKTNFNRDYWQNHFTKPKEVLSHAS